MAKYNQLTKRLLAEGDTAERYPAYVRIATSRLPGSDPLNNLYGGFEYMPKYRREMVFQTGCGLLVMGSHFDYGSMSFMGIQWTVENDNPVICCPFRSEACTLRNPLLKTEKGGGLWKMVWCDCHQTGEAYAYGRSLDKAYDDRDRQIQAKYEEFSIQAGGHVCRLHMCFDEWADEWRQEYNPVRCAGNCRNVGETCDLTGELVSRKKGNVFYDVKITRIRNDGTLFDGQEEISIRKGVRLFEKMQSLTICRRAVLLCKEYIQEEEERKWYRQRLTEGVSVEVFNIRAEYGESRDLDQDLRDIRNGIAVVHESDLKRQATEQKRERRKKTREARIRRLEKKLLEVGYYSLKERDLDRIHADKWLEPERIAELERLRKRRAEEQRREPRQMELADYIDFNS